jgi:hypothetical protein
LSGLAREEDLPVTATSDCLAFAYKETAVSVGEVVRSALFRGALESNLTAVARKDACQEEADRLDLEADEAAVDAAVERFRYENDLISAEETERWLGARGLSAEQLEDYFVRGHWAETLGEKVEAAARPPVTAELLGALEIELLMSGAFAPLANALGRRLLVRDRAEVPASGERVEAERRRFLKGARLKPRGVQAWLDVLGRDGAWLEAMLGMEAAYREKCESVLTADRLARTLSSARLPLTRLEVERVEFDSVDAAREAHLCVREDGLALEEVARQTRYPFERLECVAEDLPEDERQRLLCAPVGEVQEPVQAEGVFRLTRVTRRKDPELSDALVRERLERRILDLHFSETGSKDIRWVIQ